MLMGAYSKCYKMDSFLVPDFVTAFTHFIIVLPKIIKYAPDIKK